MKRQVDRRRHGQDRHAPTLGRAPACRAAPRSGAQGRDRPDAINVPHVKGLSLTDATNLLRHARVHVDARPVSVNSPKATQNFVVGSTPKEGTAAKPDQSSTLKFASGSVQVADVTGHDVRRRRPRRSSQAHAEADLPEPAKPARPKGNAFATIRRRSGTTGLAGPPITVFISSGPSQVALPNVVGEHRRPGQARPEIAGLRGHGDAAGRVHRPDARTTSSSRRTLRRPDRPARHAPSTSPWPSYRPSDPSCGGPPARHDRGRPPAGGRPLRRPQLGARDLARLGRLGRGGARPRPLRRRRRHHRARRLLAARGPGRRGRAARARPGLELAQRHPPRRRDAQPGPRGRPDRRGHAHAARPLRRGRHRSRACSRCSASRTSARASWRRR